MCTKLMKVEKEKDIHILKILLPERKLYQEKEKDYKIFTILVYLHGVILK